jgi:4'-phosphopantetheinyl transferase
VAKIAYKKYHLSNPGQVQVWYAHIDRPWEEILAFERLISQEESARAKRFKNNIDRQRYIVRQGILRELLAGYLDCGPCQVEMRSGANGKPCLAGQEKNKGLQFSVSHSDAVAAYAFIIGRSIGVDTERIRNLPDMLEIVDQYFTLREGQALRSCPEDQRLILFYRFWTRKEAVLKAQGDGLLRQLDSVDVATNEEYGPWKVFIKEGSVAEEYSVTDIEGPAGFAAAVAMADPITQIAIQHYPV